MAIAICDDSAPEIDKAVAAGFVREAQQETVMAVTLRDLPAALLTEALRRAETLGAKRAFVLSDLPFYEKLGFRKTQHYTFYRKA